MKDFKPYIVPVTILIIIDQTVKLFISNMFMDNRFTFGFLKFHPIQNTNLSFAGNFIEILSNMWVMVFINIVVIVLLITGYKFYKYKVNHVSTSVKLIVIFGLAGSVCSLIDKLFWGGSLDFIQITGFFTFDFKDCYLTVFEIIFIILGLLYNKHISISEYLNYWTKKNTGKGIS